MSLKNPGDLHTEHDQGLPSDVWVCQHRLGKHPSVTIVDSAGNEVDGQVEHLNFNTCRITFNAAFSGKAFFN